MAGLIEATRVFRFNGRDLVDPEPSMSGADVLEHYTDQFPQLLGGKVVGPTMEGDNHIYELRASFGDKG